MQWNCADLGSPPIAGTQDLSGTTWTVSGSGDVYGTGDAAHAVTQPVAGTVVLTAEVTDESAADAWAKTGIMVRAGTDPGAATYTVVRNAGDGSLSVGVRATQGMTLTYPVSTSGPNLPVYLRITRSGDSFSAAYSSDAVTFTPITGSTSTLAISSTAQVGLVVANAYAATSETAQFDQVSLAGLARTLTYRYDGLGELTGAVENPGSTFAYTYDPAGNRTSVSVNGTQTASYSYDAADQVTNPGWTYDAAGNLTSDGTTSSSYDALNRLTGTSSPSQTASYSYNGDGTLAAATNGITTTSTQDLAAGQSQVLASTTSGTTSDYLYGSDTAPLASLASGSRTWYGLDGQGSVRLTLDDSGNVLGTQSYDPHGQAEPGSTLSSLFGYTGQVQDLTSLELRVWRAHPQVVEMAWLTAVGTSPICDSFALSGPTILEWRSAHATPTMGMRTPLHRFCNHLPRKLRHGKPRGARLGLRRRSTPWIGAKHAIRC